MSAERGRIMSNCRCSENKNVAALTQTNKIALNQEENQTCPAIGYQKATVCVPVTVTPFARAKTTTSFCCGDPIITPGRVTCPGTVNGSCTFTITQNICVAVPVDFGATTYVGAPAVQCGDATKEDVCTNCAES